MTTLLDRITVLTDQCGGRPCVRGMRIRLIDITDLMASGPSAQDVLAELPDLEMDDVRAALRYASRSLDRR